MASFENSFMWLKENSGWSIVSDVEWMLWFVRSNSDSMANAEA